MPRAIDEPKGATLIERDEYPAGVPCWVDTDQPDPEAAAAFYGGLFGWEFENRMPADAPGPYFVARLRGRDVAGIGTRPEGEPPTPAWNTYVCVESADEAVATARDAGGAILMEPFDVLDAGRMAVLADPSGAVFCVWQAKEHAGARLVNEPGTWNFSSLNTPDLDGAKAFYGTAFGWESSELQMDGADFAMWRLPGYGDFLATLDPDIRARQSSQGAPPGFEDVVAWLMPMAGPGELAAHWGVTFAVDDTDAMADRALELGGTITVPPFDAGPTRVAVLTDPQGAVFTVSTYEPETD